MVIVLHGDNQVASRKRLTDIREHYVCKNWEIVNLNKVSTLESINLSSRAQTLLGEGMIVVVEDFFSNKKTFKNLASHIGSGNVVFWESRELPKTLISGFSKNWKVENYPIPQVAFKFLDAIVPGKPAGALRILQNMPEDDAFSLLPFLGWHMRYLIWADEEPDTLNLPSWRKQKLVAQASNFEIGNLYALHEKLLALDRSIKTGTNILSPKSSLESLISNL